LKLPSLLTQFLYKYKKLSLPGIGVFVLDPSAVIPDEHNKDVHIPAHGIEFKRSSSHDVDDELIEYIKAHTGKMKSLAVADLESYLTLGTELLNIGKPFYLDGIGTLTKNKEGKFEFSPGEYSVVKTEDGDGEKQDRHHKRKPLLEETSYEHGQGTSNARKILVAVSIVAGVSVIAWGGYIMYRKSANTASNQAVTSISADSLAAKTDSSAKNSLHGDSSTGQPSLSSSYTGGKDSILYKFVILRTHDKTRALKRYNQLLSYDLKVRMETLDSSFFKVYFSFPAASRDTVHVKDSLLRVYAHPVTIEK
jgi:hypothetical protein